MSEKELKTSEEWQKEGLPDGILWIMDPDGWDRQNWKFSWHEEKITREEFNLRVLGSTVQIQV